MIPWVKTHFSKIKYDPAVVSKVLRSLLSVSPHFFFWQAVRYFGSSFLPCFSFYFFVSKKQKKNYHGLRGSCNLGMCVCPSVRPYVCMLSRFLRTYWLDHFHLWTGFRACGLVVSNKKLWSRSVQRPSKK